MLRPKNITDRLGISAPTLRLWSNNFSDVLSPGAQKSTTETGAAAQRRYTDEDLALFRRAQELLNSGKTYDQTLATLKSEPVPEIKVEEPAQLYSNDKPGPSNSPVIVTDTHPIIAAFERALEAKDETIRTKDELIETLHLTIASKDKEIETLQAHAFQPGLQPKTTTLQPRFRWGFLNKLLTGQAQDVG